MSSIADLEANYAWCLERYQAAPTQEKAKELAKKQVLIDQLLREKKWSLRWFTEEELDQLGDDADTWPTEPRKPLPVIAANKPPKVDRGVEMEPQTIKWHGYTTLTLDSLIAMLQELRKTRSGDTPVIGVEFGGYSGFQEVLEEEDCIVIE